MSEPVRIPGDGGVRLEGRLFGSGEVGVALAHMRPGDQSQWFELAGLLANNGYRVLTYNRRGNCQGGEFGCSGGNDDVGAWRTSRSSSSACARREHGGSSWAAPASARLSRSTRSAEDSTRRGSSGSPVSICTKASPSPSRRAAFGSKLFLAGEFDSEAGISFGLRGDCSEPTQVITLDTGEHGTDILAYADVAVADEFREAVLDFLARI